MARRSSEGRERKGKVVREGILGRVRGLEADDLWWLRRAAVRHSEGGRWEGGSARGQLGGGVVGVYTIRTDCSEGP